MPDIIPQDTAAAEVVPEAPADRLAAAFDKVMRSLRVTVAKRIRARIRQTPDLAGHASLVASAEIGDPNVLTEAEWVSALTSTTEDILAEIIADASVGARVGVSFDVSDPAVARLVRSHLRAIGNYGPSLTEDLATWVGEEVASGASVEQIVRRLRTESPLSENAARSLARTEAVAASNAAVAETWAASGVVRMKQFLATDDDRTRPDHVDANGQTVPLSDFFVIGGSLGMYPGDPSLPPEQRVNCRCTMIAITDGAEVEPIEVKTAEFAHRGHVQCASGIIRTVRTTASPGATFQADTSGGMIALLPDAPESLVVDGGDPAELLHVTLRFVAEDATALDERTVSAITFAAAMGAQRRAGPLVATVVGYGQLGSADPPATVLFVQADDDAEGGFSAIRHEVDEIIEEYGEDAFPPDHDGFLPHLSLGYGVPLESAAPFVGTQITFSSGVSAVLGGEESIYPWGNPAQEATTMPKIDTSNTIMPKIDTSNGASGGGLQIKNGPLLEAMADEALGKRNNRKGMAAPGADTIDIGSAVRWYETPADGSAPVERTGVVLELLDNNGEVTLTVAPDDDPENPIELMLADVELIPDQAGPDVQPNAAEGLYAVADDGSWEGVLIIEGSPSGDGRMIQEGALTWRELPLPLMAMFRNPEGGVGHDGAELAGRIDSIERRGTEIWGTGVLDMGSAVGVEMHRLMSEGFMRGVSADLDDVIIEWENQFDDQGDIEDLFDFDPGMMIVTSGRVMGATGTTFPAFQEAQIWLVGDAPADPEVALVASAGLTDGAQVRVFTPWTRSALVASAGVAYPVAPPAVWFERPSDVEITELRANGRALKVLPDGRVYGIAAVFGECHIGFPGRCVSVPRSRSNYAYLRTGEVHCADGSIIGTAVVFADTVHPDLSLAAKDASAHYGDTGCGVVDVAVWDDDRLGCILFAGALRPEVTPTQLRTLRASDGVSPDWRRIGGRLEAVALLTVNSSGFKVPALVASGGEALKFVAPGRVAVRLALGNQEPLALVAAGGLHRAQRPDRATLMGLYEDVVGLRAEVAELRGQIRPFRAERAAARLGSIAPTEVTANVVGSAEPGEVSDHIMATLASLANHA